MAETLFNKYMRMATKEYDRVRRQLPALLPMIDKANWLKSEWPGQYCDVSIHKAWADGYNLQVNINLTLQKKYPAKALAIWLDELYWEHGLEHNWDGTLAENFWVRFDGCNTLAIWVSIGTSCERVEVGVQPIYEYKCKGE